MTGLAGEPRGYQDRFPGFGVLSQAGHWDQVTADAVTARVDPPPVPKFFSGPAEACARALLNLLTGQHEQDDELTVPVLELVDARLAAGETDGWRYDDMPEDGQAWRETLAHLDADAEARCGTSFADAPEADQAAVLRAVQDLKSAAGTGCPPLTCGACGPGTPARPSTRTRPPGRKSAFPGRRDPRGYKNAGVGKLEPFEVPDARPAIDPVRRGD